MIKADVRSSGLQEAQRAILTARNFIRKGDEEIMAVLGKVSIYYIIERTAKGKDIEGQRFEPYSKKYSERKGSSKVDLKVSGKMIQAIKKQAASKKVRIYVKNSTRGMKLSSYNLAVVHNFGANTGKAYIPKREFMGLTAKEIKLVRQTLEKLLRSRISKIMS